MLIFLSVFFLVVGIGLYWKAKREQAVEWITQTTSESHRVRNKQKSMSTLELKIRQAGLSIKPYQLILLSVGLLVMAYVVVSFLFNSPLYGMVAAFLSLWFVRIIIQRNITHRSQLMSEQLVSALRMMGNAIRGGSHLQQAMEYIVDQLENPLRSEFEQILDDIHGNMSVAQAFREAKTRIPVPEFQNVVMAVEIGMAAGADLPKSFDSASVMIEKRRELKEKVMAQTEGIRGQGKAVIGLVIIVFFISRIAFAEGYTVALQKPAGKFLMFVSMSMIIATILYMRNKVKNMDL